MSQVPDPAASKNDSRLAKVLEEYLAALEAGKPPDKEQLLAKYPELTDDLEGCLASLEFIRRAAVGPQLADQDAQLPRQPLGDFRIVKEIGRGGMGVVYEAEQISLKRRVALKVLPFAAVLDQKQLQRFKNEPQAAASLRHPNIVGIYSVGCERGVHYYAMDYVEGQTLAQVITELRQPEKGTGPIFRDGPTNLRSVPGASHKLDLSPFPPPEADTKREPQAAISTEASHPSSQFFRSVASLGIQAAKALEHAHRMGVVHRDIKPSNLMVDGNGHLWITDFGLARIQAPSPLAGEGRGEGGNLTMTGDVLGTLRYMSPEQMQAKRGVLDHRTDVYSLGVTLYELLTLQPAVVGNDRARLIRQILEEDPRPPRQLNKAIPKDLETIVLKATCKEPQARYATAQELVEDLQRFLADEPIRARRPSLVERWVKWARRHRRPIGWWIATFVVAAVVSAVSTILIARAYLTETARGLIEKSPVGLRRSGPPNPRITGKADVAAPQGQPRLAVTPSKVAEWHFENSFDDSVGSHHGEAVGEVRFVDGVRGRAAHLDGASYIRVADAPDLSAMADFTVQAWIRPASLPPHAGIVTKLGTGPASDDEFYLNLKAGRVRFHVCSGLEPQGQPPGQLDSKRRLEAGRWYHIEACFRGSDEIMELYIDGALDSTRAAVLRRLNDTDEPIKIGLYMSGFGEPARFFQGDIDELVIWQGRPKRESVVKPPEPPAVQYETLYEEDFSSEPAGWVFNSPDVYWDAENQRLAMTSLEDYSGNAYVRVPAPRGSFRLSWTLGITKFDCAGTCIPALSSYPNRNLGIEPHPDDLSFVMMGFNSSDRDGENAHMVAARDGGREFVDHRATWLKPNGKVYHLVTEYDAETSTVRQTIRENGEQVGCWTGTTSAIGSDMQYIAVTGNYRTAGWLDNIRLQQPVR